MDLVDRYLASIRRNLPAAKSEDIAAELADDLHSRIEHREARMGRPLDRDEISAILREFGHPLVIAARYRPHQYLIGPDVYPFYLFVMKVVLATGAALLVGVATLALVLGDSAIARPVLRAAGSLWSFFFIAGGIVTLTFAVLERSGFPADHLARWKPEQLPDIAAGRRNQWNSAMEVGIGLAFILWWAGWVTIPILIRRNVLIEPTLVWEAFWLPILLQACLQLFVNLVKWLRPRSTTFIGLATIASSLFMLAIIAGLSRYGPWVAVASAGAGNPGVAKIAESVNLAIQVAFIAVGALMVFQILAEAWKLIRPLQSRSTRPSR